MKRFDNSDSSDSESERWQNLIVTVELRPLTLEAKTLKSILLDWPSNEWRRNTIELEHYHHHYGI